jgi:hypothetical protein
VPTLSSYDYAFVRVVPSVTREEFINAGVILFCREQGFLGVRLALDEKRLLDLAPEIDLLAVLAQLRIYRRICAGGPESGPIGQLSPAERFHWLTSPRSTTVQVSPVHCGLCSDPEATLEDLMRRIVTPDRADAHAVNAISTGSTGEDPA